MTPLLVGEGNCEAIIAGWRAPPGSCVAAGPSVDELKTEGGTGSQLTQTVIGLLVRMSVSPWEFFDKICAGT